MTFTSDLGRFTVGTKAGLNELTRECVKEAGRRLIERSPIDTGRFKSNYFYGLVSPDTRSNDRTNVRVLNNLDELPIEAAGYSHFITNSLPYAPALEAGYSRQAPKGMFGLTALEWPQIVKVAAIKAGLRS